MLVRQILSVGATLLGALGVPVTSSGFPDLFPSLYAVNLDTPGCLAAPDRVHTGSGRCENGDAYRWRVELSAVRLADLMNARFHLRNAGTGRCLTVANGARGSGAAAVQFACDGAASRAWRFRDAPGPGIYVINVNSGKCLGVSGGHPMQEECAPGNGSRWSFRTTPTGEGVIHVDNGKP